MSSDSNDNIASRAVRGSAYSVAGSAVTIILGFVRTTVMLRLLLPEDYGVTTLAIFYINLAAELRGIGLDNAFIHHKEKQNETIRNTYFSLTILLLVGSLLILAAFIPFLNRFYSDYNQLGIVLIAYMGITLIKGLNTVQVTFMTKRLAFRSLSVLDVASAIVMTIVGPLMAWQGFGLWSIVAEQFSGVFTRFLLIWGYYRAWRPRFGWDTPTARWFLNYGSKVWMSKNFTYVLDRFDDFWIGTTLGKSPLGFYSRAYDYARYPRKVISNPILSVFFPAFARLQDDKLRLSRAFFRAISLMVRGGFLFSLIFILTAPEFIPILLTDKWLPMLVTFQLMIVYTLFDPLSTGAQNLLMATGYPGIVMRIRFVQTAVFVPAVIIFSTLAGIEGVAFAADIMIIIGTLLLFRETTRIVEYSQKTLWLWPFVALVITAVLILLLNPLWVTFPLWGALIAKGALITLLYLGILWLAERQQLLIGWNMIWSLIKPGAKTT